MENDYYYAYQDSIPETGCIEPISNVYDYNGDNVIDEGWIGLTKVGREAGWGPLAIWGAPQDLALELQLLRGIRWQGVGRVGEWAVLVASVQDAAGALETCTSR